MTAAEKSRYSACKDIVVKYRPGFCGFNDFQTPPTFQFKKLTKAHRFVALLSPIQFNHLRTPEGYPKEILTIGDHIRAVRLERGEFQIDVAEAIGVSVETILHWELRQTKVKGRCYPKIMEYLGYCPIPEDTGTPTLGIMVRRHRLHRGLTVKEAALYIGVDPAALSNWERNIQKPTENSTAKLLKFVGATVK